MQNNGSAVYKEQIQLAGAKREGGDRVNSLIRNSCELQVEKQAPVCLAIRRAGD